MDTTHTSNQPYQNPAGISHGIDKIFPLMEPLISIIIPFHNEALYLSRALTSAVNQSYPNIEVILVNDASTDASLSIAENFKAIHQNVRIISINGHSLGKARNAGIAVSQGIYISFLDADDVLDKDAISHLYNSMLQHGSDIAIGKFSLIDNNKTIQHTMGWKMDGLPKSGVEAALAMYQYQIVYTVWAKLLKANLVKEIPFVEDLWFEDRVFMLPYFLRSKTVSFIDERVLEYQSRPESITRRFVSTKRLTDIFKVYILELASIKGYMQEKALQKAIDRHEINSFIENLIFLYFDCNKVSNFSELKQCYAQQLKLFLLQLKTNNSGIGKRDRLDILILQLYSIIGWKFTFILLPFLKQKKCRSIAALRSS